MTWRRNWKNRVLQGGKRGGVKLGSSVFVLGGRGSSERERGVKIAFLTLLSISLSLPSLHWGGGARMGRRRKKMGMLNFEIGRKTDRGKNSFPSRRN